MVTRLSSLLSCTFTQRSSVDREPARAAEAVTPAAIKAIPKIFLLFMIVSLEVIVMSLVHWTRRRPAGLCFK
jgi:hypothetical protein